MDINHFLVRWIFLASCLVILACSGEKQKSWEVINARLETELEIGSDSIAFLSNPSFLVVDSNNNIIIADRGRLQLLVFNRNGQFSHVIGKRGPGPDEFRDIKGMTISDNDEIMVFDRSSQTLKTFSVSGKYLKSSMLPSSITTNVKFSSWENLQLLFFIKPNPGLDQNYLLHIHSEDYGRVITKAIPYQDLDNFNENIIPLFMGSVGSILMLEDRLLFSPAIYNGYIYEYALFISDSSMTVDLIKKIPGDINKEAISIVSRNQSNSSKYADIKVSNPETTMRILMHNQSKGLYKLKDGNIIHFTYVEDKEGSKRVFGFELYDKTLRPLGYASLRVKPFSKDSAANNLLEWDVMAKDEDDRFYIVDTSQDIPKIRVVRLDYQILNE